MRWRWVAVLALVAVLAGCATSEGLREQRAKAMASPTLSDAYSPNPSGYSHPLRVVGFALHPVGVIADYVIVRPIYLLTGAFPAAFGYQEEDARAFHDHIPELAEPKPEPTKPY